MNTYNFFLAFVCILLLGQNSFAALEKDKCQIVRLSDGGWADVTITTKLASMILESLGYTPKTAVLSGPVTYKSIENNDIDVFLGTWLPSGRHIIKPYLKRGSISLIKKNMTGGKYTLAVPKYMYEKGVTHFKDLHKFADDFNRQIYGINSGSQGNSFILKMIKNNEFNLKDFKLVSSSEQGMLMEVNQAINEKRAIVFLAWSPHPMNIAHEIKYLKGGDKYFGENYGNAEVFTTVRKNFASDCPNLANFLKNFTFTPQLLSYMMDLVANKGHTAQEASLKALKNNPQLLDRWLKDVETIDQNEGFEIVKQKLLDKNNDSDNDTITNTAYKIPIGKFLEKGINFITTRFSSHFRAFSAAVESVLNTMFTLAFSIHPTILILCLALLIYALKKNVLFTFLCVCGQLIIFNLGYFEHMIKSLVLVVTATSICVFIGVPLGIAAARKPLVYKVIRPILDLMQTIPTFVYLLPTLMLFGLGMVPGLISTIIFAIAAPIRLTYLGIKHVPKHLIDAADSFGADFYQCLFKVELPHALPSIFAGITQCIMLSLSMVVIAALVGAEGLGEPVVRALNTVDVAKGIESGLSIVILAVILDRLFKKQSHMDGAGA